MEKTFNSVQCVQAPSSSVPCERRGELKINMTGNKLLVQKHRARAIEEGLGRMQVTLGRGLIQQSRDLAPSAAVSALASRAGCPNSLPLASNLLCGEAEDSLN